MNITPINYSNQNSKPAFKARPNDLSELVQHLGQKGKFGSDFLDILTKKADEIAAIKLGKEDVFFNVNQKKGNHRIFYTVSAYTQDNPNVMGKATFDVSGGGLYSSAKKGANLFLDALKAAVEDIKAQPDSINKSSQRFFDQINSSPIYSRTLKKQTHFDFDTQDFPALNEFFENQKKFGAKFLEQVEKETKTLNQIKYNGQEISFYVEKAESADPKKNIFTIISFPKAEPEMTGKQNIEIKKQGLFVTPKGEANKFIVALKQSVDDIKNSYALKEKSAQKPQLAIGPPPQN